ncbi:DUF2510 domain-containing protein, partial [Streptomyces sp. 24-1644]|uniref:DUF2510 domain-containing protein n=1 Tax=Streptomyces sp. 24-1644 TaxID=3457315 RepID=UPI003FA75A5B
MSAPTPAPGDDSPREGYYPDPSIPGYVRYWNGASWVPGTSRPAPQQGETAPAPPPSDAAAAPGQRAASMEETGPVFFDEVDDVDEVHGTDGAPGAAGRPPAGSRSEAAPSWQADTSRQTGFGGDRDRRVSWEVCAETGASWVEKDITQDEALYREYWEQIPVVLVDDE